MNEQNQGNVPAQPDAQPQSKPRAQAKLPEAPKQAPKPAENLAMPRNRHDVSFRHDVFVSDVKQCIRNTSYEAMKLVRVDVEHKHVYHSHNNQGKKLNRTGSACGHWHYIEHYVDPTTGATLAKCGPAMNEVTKMSPTGRTYSVIEAVNFEEEVLSGPMQGQVRKVVDDHRHEMNYLGYEELSPLGIQNGLKEQRALAAAMGISIDPQAVRDNTPAPMTPADGATIT